MMSHGHGSISHPLEVVGTVMEVADVTWTALEHYRHHRHHDDHSAAVDDHDCPPSENGELASLCSENQHLRGLLEQNIRLLQEISQSPSILKDCPPDLYKRLVATVDSKKFLSKLESLHQESLDVARNNFPFKEVTGSDLHTVELLVSLDREEPSWWVWVSDEVVTEEWSGLDNENYVIVGEEHVVEGVANFMARCILSNPKAKKLSPEELQKTVAKALGGVNKMEKMLSIWNAGKMFYALSTWGLALAGLYRHRAILKAAAKGVKASSNLVLRAL
ncbi:uncharacterized protein LOC122084408 [Macadamia integrifolia]|uniref:uncharacterized protein LOC122084408 n=1 Tax=Macadamia integrifolia TaxID=60698 RepID=UPI001C4FC0C9|nr:uncharacterized protein LOC122084408 [Macadamia integrifolia]